MTFYQAITIHIILDKLETVSIFGLFQCHELHTAKYIKMNVCQLLSEWEIEGRKFLYFTDNAANMKTVAYALCRSHA